MNTTTQWPDAISDKKRDTILQLIFTTSESADEREKWLSELESATENDTEDLIKILSNAHS